MSEVKDVGCKASSKEKLATGQMRKHSSLESDSLTQVSRPPLGGRLLRKCSARGKLPPGTAQAFASGVAGKPCQPDSRTILWRKGNRVDAIDTSEEWTVALSSSRS